MISSQKESIQFINYIGVFDAVVISTQVDIENAEWDAFKNIASDPLFDAVGQVSYIFLALFPVLALYPTAMHLTHEYSPVSLWLQVQFNILLHSSLIGDDVSEYKMN